MSELDQEGRIALELGHELLKSEPERDVMLCDILGAQLLYFLGEDGKESDALRAGLLPVQPLYGIWCGGAWGKEWGKDASGRVVFSTDADILERNKGDWGVGAKVREITPAMRWWLVRGVNMVG